MNFLVQASTRRALPVFSRSLHRTPVSMFSDGFRDAPRLQYKDIKPLTKAPTEVS